MEYRKLIKFGNNSYVVSLPKQWLEANNLKKGATVYVEPSTNQLLLSATPIDTTDEPRSAVLDCRKLEVNTFRRMLITHYINNYQSIKILIDERSDTAKIREVIHSMMALEILEQTRDHILARDYVNLSQVNIESLIGKIDNIVRSMFSDIHREASSNQFFENIALVDAIHDRDLDVNRLFFLIMRTVKYRMSKPQLARGSESAQQLVKYYDMVLALEQAADDLKRISRRLVGIETGKHPALVNHISDVRDFYLASIRAYHKNRVAQAFEIGSRKHEMMANSTGIMDANKDVIEIIHVIHYLRNLVTSIHNINRVTYQ